MTAKQTERSVNRILVGTDPSTRSDQAIPRATLVAKQLGSRCQSYTSSMAAQQLARSYDSNRIILDETPWTQVGRRHPRQCRP